MSRYQYTFDFLYASSLKDQSSSEPYQKAISAILRRMLIDDNTLHGALKEPTSYESISAMTFEQIEQMVKQALKNFESKVNLDNSYDSDDDIVEGFLS